MICHHYKCIFVHIPKNAGQSIETVFVNLLGLTWETRAPLLLRESSVPELGPHVLAHLKISEYLRYKYISPDLFESYFKFAFVRNPWARMVSFYKFLNMRHYVSFKVFVEKAYQKKLHEFESWYDWFVSPQCDFLCDENGMIAVNFIGRFEHLEEDFNYVRKTLNIATAQLPHINASKNSNKPRSLYYSLHYFLKTLKYFLKYHRLHPYPVFDSYTDYYDKESELMVEDFYRKDIEIFGYKFNNNDNVFPKILDSSETNQQMQ